MYKSVGKVLKSRIKPPNKLTTLSSPVTIDDELTSRAYQDQRFLAEYH